jgi:hypothetical protein
MRICTLGRATPIGAIFSSGKKCAFLPLAKIVLALYLAGFLNS